MAAKQKAKARRLRRTRAAARKKAAADATTAAAAAPSASLSTLPPEIIQHINGYIPEHDWTTRNALARTSRRLHHELNYSLYRVAVHMSEGLWGLKFYERAAVEGKVSTLQRLISYALCRHRDLTSMLTFAVYGNQHECVRLLLAHGAHVPMCDQYGYPILFFCKDAAMVMTLLAAGAQRSINRTVFDGGGTALHHASALGSREVVVALLRHGADPTVGDMRFRAARDLWSSWIFGTFPSCRCLWNRRHCIVHR